jgi:hypothetical protein
LHAQEKVVLREQFPAGYQYHVSSRVDLSGSLTLPPEKGQAPKALAVTGSSAIEYDERVLGLDKKGQVDRTARIYRRIDFERKVGEQKQQNTIRPAVRRLVILRHKQMEVPFSPDGPLTWGEMDLIRTDVFTPALTGLLPQQAVKAGDSWVAAAEAIQELTDLEKLEGTVTCKLEQFTTMSKRRYARVSLKGTVTGVNEDGRARHSLQGHFFFDLESNHLSYLSVKGVNSLLDKDGKSLGKVEGNFVLTRQAPQKCKELSDEGLKGVGLEPSADNTLLLYDNPDLGVRLLHPRRWRVAGVRGRQLALDEAGGSGLMLTLEPLKNVPTGAQFLQEAQQWMAQQKVKVLRVEQPRVLQAKPKILEHFALEADINKERILLDYYVIRQAKGGATLVARLLPGSLKVVRPEAERIARSVEVTGVIAEAPKK